MTLTEKELDHLAKLSKLNLKPEEKEKFQKGLESIVDFLGQLNEIDTSESEEIEEESKITPFTQQEKFDDPKALIKNSAHQKGDFIAVKTSLKA